MNSMGESTSRDDALRFERTQALVGIIWIVGWWALVVYCIVRGSFGLAFGSAFASLALPIVLPVSYV